MSSFDPVSSSTRKPGRPLDPEADRQIADATMELMSEVGFAALTIDAVAARAGVARTTVYRRYKDKLELVMAAIEEKRPRLLPELTGDARADLLVILNMWRQRVDPGLAGTMLIEARSNPKVLEPFRARVVAPMRGHFERILRSGIESGQLRADLDVDAVIDAMLGSVLARVLTEGRPDERWTQQMFDVIWPALRA